MLRMSTKLSSFQTHGMAPLTQQASAGGVAAASKRPFLLSPPPPAVLALASPFGGREKTDRVRENTFFVLFGDLPKKTPSKTPPNNARRRKLSPREAYKKTFLCFVYYRLNKLLFYGPGSDDDELSN